MIRILSPYHPAAELPRLKPPESGEQSYHPGTARYLLTTFVPKNNHGLKQKASCRFELANKFHYH